MRLALLGILLLFNSACASLHSVSIGDIDNTQPTKKIEVKQSATGVDVEEAMNISKSFSNSRSFNKGADTVSNIWQMITYGPKTGEVTFTDSYADGLDQELIAACPSKQISGIVSMRETNKYPVISGEIVKMIAYCRKAPL